jgi:hypothetical protein
MANPRNIVRFHGIGREAQTFIIDASTITYDVNQPNGSAQVGKAVKLSGNATIALATDGSHVLGKLELVEADGKATVQTEGYMSLPGGDGATLTLGAKIVGDLGPSSAAGYIRAVATGTAAELGMARGMIIDPSVTTEVWVKLE